MRIAEQYIQAFSNIAKEVVALAYKLFDMQFPAFHSLFILKFVSYNYYSFLFPQGTTMLLPSSASNPANMMAQALTMYKSLVGNVSSDKLNGAKPPAIEGEVEDDLFGKVKDVSSTTATRAPKKGNSL